MIISGLTLRSRSKLFHRSTSSTIAASVAGPASTGMNRQANVLQAHYGAPGLGKLPAGRDGFRNVGVGRRVVQAAAVAQYRGAIRLAHRLRKDWLNARGKVGRV